MKESLKLHHKQSLFVSNVGSHMWQMNHSKSDIDLFNCFKYDNYSILSGIKKPKSFQYNDTPEWEWKYHATRVDEVQHEIGILIQQLLKSNVNFLWGVMSPIPISCHPHFQLKRLQTIIKDNLSKQVYHSIHGLAVHNFKHYLNDAFPPLEKDEKLMKKARIIMRTLNFGINLLLEEEFLFESIGYTTKDIIENMIDALDTAFFESNLPAKIPNPDQFYDFLYDTRMKFGR
jgi:predicted nucleotidyltransferase